MEAYHKLKELLTTVVEYFKRSPDGVTNDDLIEAFGEGIREFLEGLEEGSKDI